MSHERMFHFCLVSCVRRADEFDRRQEQGLRVKRSHWWTNFIMDKTNRYTHNVPYTLRTLCIYCFNVNFTVTCLYKSIYPLKAIVLSVEPEAQTKFFSVFSKRHSEGGRKISLIQICVYVFGYLFVLAHVHMHLLPGDVCFCIDFSVCASVEN